MAAAAGGADIFLCQERCLPELNISVRGILFGCQALAAMTDGASESRRNMRTEAGVIAERFGRVLHCRIVNAEMAGGAAVNALQSQEAVSGVSAAAWRERQTWSLHWVRLATQVRRNAS